MTPFSIRRAIVVGYLIALGVIFIFILYTYLNMQHGERENRRLNKTLQSLKLVENVFDDIQNIESAQRGYIISGDSNFLTPYFDALARLRSDTQTLQTVKESEPERQNDIQQILELIRAKIRFAEKTIALRTQSGIEPAMAAVKSDEGRLLMTAIRERFIKIETEDRILLSKLNDNRESIGRLTTILFVILGVLFLLSLISFFILIKRDIRWRLHAELNSQVTQKTDAFKNILDRISDGFIALDKDWRYVYVNNKACEIIGRKPSEILGKDMWAEYPKDIGNEFYKAYHKAMQQQEYVFLEAYYADFDMWLENHIYPSPGGLSLHFRDITERKRVEAELQKTREKLEIVAKATNDVLWEADLVAQTLSWNDNFYTKFGYSKGEGDKSDRSWETYLHPDDKARVLNEVAKVIADKTQMTWTDEYRFAKADGVYLNIFDRCYIVRDNEGNAIRMIGSMADVTSLFETKKELQRTEEQYTSLVHTVDGIVWEADGQTFKFNFVSRQAERLLGYPVEQWTSEPDFWVNHIHEDDRDWAVGFCMQSVKEKRAHEFEYRMIAADNSVVWLRDIVSVVVENDEAVLLRGLMIDITTSKKADDEIRHSEEKYRTLVEQATDGIFIAGPNGRFIMVNSSGCKLSQYTEEELKGMTIYDLADEEDLKVNPFHFEEMKSENGARVERKMRKKDGTLIDIEVNAKFLSDSRFLAFIRDITDKKKAAQEVVKARELADTLIDSLPGVFYFYDHNGKFIRWNKQFEKVTGYTGKEIESMHPTDFFTGAEKDYIAERIGLVFRDGISDAEANFVMKSGKMRPYYFKAALLNYEGKPCLLGTGIDITERVKAEQKLQESLQEIRQLTDYIQNIREEERAHMAREIHDELGQHLTVLKMDVSWLNKRVGHTDEQVRQKLKSLTDMLDGTVKTVRRISSELRPSLLDDLGLIAAIDWHLKEFEKRSGVETEFEEPSLDLSISDVVKTGLYRIFQESLTNVARHAESHKVKVSLQHKDGLFVLSILDDGKGFEKETSDKTLGILGMKERTAMMGGTYEINSQPGKGTLVVVSVPVSA
jgi:PAS domain S-box-containing protein